MSVGGGAAAPEVTVGVVSFSAAGDEVAARVAAALRACPAPWGDARVTALACHGAGHERLEAWVGRTFGAARALVFVGAAGIAVRAVAPHVASKATDPAVLAVDEAATWVVPLLSGHLGGANELARSLAARLGAQAVVTTATDVRGVWSPDDWARREGLAVASLPAARDVAARLLAGETIRLASDVPLVGEPPAQVTPVGAGEPADVVVSPRAPVAPDGALRLVPRCASVGVGCRRGTPAATILARVDAALREARLSPLAVAQVASIDLKADEPGLRDACAARGWRLVTFSAEELARVRGSVSASPFVARVTGVDNVCERAALACGGALALPRRAGDGVTVAIALRSCEVGFGRADGARRQVMAEGVDHGAA